MKIPNKFRSAFSTAKGHISAHRQAYIISGASVISAAALTGTALGIYNLVTKSDAGEVEKMIEDRTANYVTQDELPSDIASKQFISETYATKDEVEENYAKKEAVTDVETRLDTLEQKVSPNIDAQLAAISNASEYGFTKELARDMYRYDPQRFNEAFGVVEQAQWQVPNWFDGNPANAEAISINDSVMTINNLGGLVSICLEPDGRGAQFTIDPEKALKFTRDYLTENPTRVNEVHYN